MEMKERWQIEADIYLAEKQEQEDGVWAYGEVTVDQLMTFQVRVLTCTKENGEKTSFVTYPRRQRNGKWEDLVRPDKELREAVTKAVHQAIQNEITKDLHLPEVTVLHMTKLPVRKDQTVPILAVATVEVLGLTVSGITVKQGKDGLFCNMPQYYSEKKGYRDVVHGTTKRMQEAVFEKVLATYEMAGKEKENTK
ncbi:septation protein SpoVG family protein [Faecalimonas umbilicata]|uniref:septation protein SpoVG family protein n=1 Tax=Faecalimonas umbilicata TaxID=1912855 RepID=UPI0022E6EA7E|nr:septation protein SpoVG family protein [Faecalimonas umbilicata]